MKKSEVRRATILEIRKLVDDRLKDASHYPHAFHDGTYYIERNAAAWDVFNRLTELADKEEQP